MMSENQQVSRFCAAQSLMFEFFVVTNIGMSDSNVQSKTDPAGGRSHRSYGR